MDTETHAVPPHMPILDAIAVLIDNGVTGVPVVDLHDVVIGILSEEHCLKLLSSGGADHDRPKGIVANYVDRTVPQVSPDVDVYYLAGLFESHPKHRRFAVVENGKLVGVVTRKDVLKLLHPAVHLAPRSA
jgi:CBS domain-containing protein